MRFTALLLLLSAPLAVGAQVKVAGKAIAGDYVRTQGKIIDGWAMPYVEEYAAANHIDLERIRKALFPGGVPAAAESKAALLSSNEHVQGDWTYVISGSVMLYQLQCVEAGKAGATAVLVLYNRHLPPQILELYQKAEWRLALIDSAYTVKADCPFITRIRHDDPGLWDSIYTGLEFPGADLVAKISFAHSGGGGPRDQEFTFWFSLSAQPWRLTLVKSAQTADIY